jgi:polysaccharide biosynthesis transport protein
VSEGFRYTSFQDYIRVVRERRLIIIGVTLLFACVALVQSLMRPTIFVAEASVQFREANVDPLAPITAPGLEPKERAAIGAQSVTKATVVQEAHRLVGDAVTTVQLRGAVQAFAETGTNLVVIRATWGNAELAARIANAFAAASVAVARSEARDRYTRAAEDQQRFLDDTQLDKQVRSLLQYSLARLQQLASTVDPAVITRSADIPIAPISTQLVRNVLTASMLGLLVGASIGFAFDYFDQSVKGREELDRLGVPVLGAVPMFDTQSGQGQGGEAFRMVRASIGFASVESPIKRILVTSPHPQEGKTTVALHLAYAYALGGLRTLLLEADLRHPTLHRFFGLHGNRGLTTAIVGAVPVNEAFVNTDTRNLSVMLAGAIPPNPVELLGSGQMADLLERLSLAFDCVIIDSPPIMPVADPMALAGLCDGVVLVARVGKTDRRKLEQSVQQIEKAGGRFIGVAVNGLKSSEPLYGYE